MELWPAQWGAPWCQEWDSGYRARKNGSSLWFLKASWQMAVLVQRPSQSLTEREKVTLAFSFLKKLGGTKWSPNRAKSVRNLVRYCKNKVQPAYAKIGQILQIGIHATNTLVLAWTYEKVCGGKQGMDSCIPCKVAICGVVAPALPVSDPPNATCDLQWKHGYHRRMYAKFVQVVDTGFNIANWVSILENVKT